MDYKFLIEDRKQEIEKIERIADPEYPIMIKISQINKSTKWISIDKDEFKEIKDILTKQKGVK